MQYLNFVSKKYIQINTVKIFMLKNLPHQKIFWFGDTLNIYQFILIRYAKN
jgi:hypothetical protein